MGSIDREYTEIAVQMGGDRPWKLQRLKLDVWRKKQPSP